MRLIAKKPCNFGGRDFFIGENIPLELVAEPKKQEGLGVITIASSFGEEAPEENSGAIYTQAQLDEAVAAAKAEADASLAELKELRATMKEMQEENAQAEKKQTNSKGKAGKSVSRSNKAGGS